MFISTLKVTFGGGTHYKKLYVYGGDVWYNKPKLIYKHGSGKIALVCKQFNCILS